MSLAEIAGISTPLARALVNIMGAVLQTDFWKTGLTLHKIGIKGLTVEEATKYVTKGTVE